MTTMLRMSCLALAVASVSSCGLFRGGDRETVEVGGDGEVADGAEAGEVREVRVRASLAREQDRRDFTVRVSPFAEIPDQALEAGRYKAAVYCLKTYGGSDIAWTAGPDRPVEELEPEGDTVTLRGRCTQR